MPGKAGIRLRFDFQVSWLFQVMIVSDKIRTLLRQDRQSHQHYEKYIARNFFHLSSFIACDFVLRQLIGSGTFFLTTF